MADNEYGEARHFDFDSGGGTDLVEVTGLVFAASGGAVPVGGFDLAGQDAMAVAIVDGSGAQITSFGGGTQYQEDAALGAVGSATGTLLIGRAATSVPSSVSADADAVGLWALRNGILNVRMVDNTGSPLSVGGGTQYTENAAISADAGIGNLMIARRDDALSTLTPAADDAVGLRVGDKGALWVQIADGSGNQITSFGGGTQYAEDTALSTATGTVAIGKASTAIPSDVSADGDAVALWTSRKGALHVALVDSSGVVAGAGVQYDNDTAMGATPTGTAVVARASTAVPTAMSADGDAVAAWASREGALVQVMAPHVGLMGTPWTLAHETAQYTTTQTSTVLVAGGASEKLVVTKVQIQASGTTGGTVQLYFGTGAYSRGTNRAVFDGEFAPSSTLKPGIVMDGPFISATNGDDLLVTTSAAINPLTITVWYYVVT